MERWQNSVAVVTGASSGIGAAIVRDFIKSGLTVVGLARRQEKVEAIKESLPEELKSKLHSIKCDVSKAESVNEAFAWINDNLGGVDILVNNAGISRAGQLVSMEFADLQEVIQTNLMGVVHCTKHAFQSMQKRNALGHVFIINSVGGHKVFQLPGVPQTNLYCSSKFALTAATEIYRQEFKGLGGRVRITSISPGLVETEMIPEMARKILGDCILQPEDISQCLMFALATPQHVQIHELTVKPVGETLF